MKKRVLTIFLAVILTFSSLPSAFAAKKEQGSTLKRTNILEIWGDFEHPDSTSRIKGVKGEIVEGGANSTQHAYKLKSTQPGSGDQYIILDGPVGETFDVSFWVKKGETANPTEVWLVFTYGFDGGTSSYQTERVPITDEWTKVTFKHTCPKEDSVGNKIRAIDAVRIRFNGSGTDTAYLDELSIIPYGNIPHDYSFIETNFEGMPERLPQPERSYQAKDADFSDVAPEHWANDAITTLAKANYINGMGDGTYSPNTNVTRAQFIKMVSGLYKEDAPAYDGRFADVAGDEWFVQPLMLADTLGLINDAMKADGNIYPNKPITREEAATIAALAAAERGAKPKSDAVSSFNDEADITDWAKEGVKNAASYGMITGYEDSTYKPKNNITRAEAAQILVRIVEVSETLNIYVDDETGKDTNDGTKNAPLKSIEAARDMAATLAPKMKNDINICIRGEQFLEETFTLNETHSGKNGYNIVYTSWGDEKATITMNKKYTGFELHDEGKNIWKTFVGKGVRTRQVYFNDVKGIRSRSIGYLKNPERVADTYFLCDNQELLDLKYPREVDLVFHCLWTNGRYPIESISTENDRVKIVPHKRFYKDENILGYGRAKPVGTEPPNGTPSYLENAYELLDEQGEWYMNRHDGYLYYIPRAGEDMETMVCKIPSGERLITAMGSDYKKPLKNVKFDNLILEGTTWLYPDNNGFESIQNSYLVRDLSALEETYAAIHFMKCQNITFSNNVFRQLGWTGIDFCDGSRNIDIIGNEFYNISASAIMIDDFRTFAKRNDDVDCGLAIRRPAETWCEYINVMNNYIHDVSTDYKSSAAISAGFPRFTKINYNEISYAPYSALHLGWNWGFENSITYDFEFCYNYIHDFMADRLYDGAAIYNLGAMSPEVSEGDYDAYKKVIGNYFANPWCSDCVYPDSGSTNFYVENNVADYSLVKYWEVNFIRKDDEQYWMKASSSLQSIITKNNYSDRDYSSVYTDRSRKTLEDTILVKDGNWPQEARDIMAAAGIQAEYRDNFNLDAPKVLVCDNSWQTIPLNTPTRSGVMILGDRNKQYDLSDFDIRFWIEDDAATMDENGYITAHKEGNYEAEIAVTLGEVTQLHHMRLSLGTEIKEIAFSANSTELLTGFKKYLTITGKTSYGEEKDITDGAVVDIRPTDSGIVRISKVEGENKYLIEGLSEGKTTCTGTVTYEGKKFDVNIPVVVTEVKFGSKEAEELPFKKIDLSSNWQVAGTVKDGGLYVNGMPNRNFQTITNELVAFDMAIDPGNTWPTLALCENAFEGDYNTNSCYMFGFNEEYIEVQKFVGGARTMFFGPDSLKPIAGPGVPNLEGGKIYEYNKRFSVVIGALDTPKGTRLILTINGKNIVDYTDSTLDKIAASGNLCVYNPGGMTFWPYTGITE